jgi:hypothetical protein
MRAAVGHSDDVDTTDAIGSAIAQCAEQLAGATPRAAMLFASTTYDHAAVLAEVACRWPGLPLIGSSTDGEFSSRGGFARDSLLLVVLAGEGFSARVGLGRDLAADPQRAVRDALVGAERSPTVALTTFAPSSNASEVVRLLQAGIGHPPCAILGGLSADHREYNRMVEFCGTQVLRDSLPVLLLTGDVKVSWGIGSGWFPLGKPHWVTRSDGHIVHEIDGEPATEVFRHYWGEVPLDSLGEYPLAVFPDGPDGPWVLRAALGSDPATGSIRFAGEVVDGACVRLTEVLPEGILSGTSRSMEAAVAAYGSGTPSLALMFSCAARKWVLGSKAEQECDMLAKVLTERVGAPVPLAGFYCYGEVAPTRPGANALHNESCVSVLLG